MRVPIGMAFVTTAVCAIGCATTSIQPGHRGLSFAPGNGGLRREVLMPGKYPVTANRIHDFDVTYSQKLEHLRVQSVEGLDIDVTFGILYRPIVAELYQLDTEIGPQYYEEVIAPEARSACRAVFAHQSYADLGRRSEAIENEVETELRRRTTSRHVESASVTLQSFAFAPEIAERIRQKVVAEADAAREAAEYERNKLQIERENELLRLHRGPACGDAGAARRRRHRARSPGGTRVVPRACVVVHSRAICARAAKPVHQAPASLTALSLFGRETRARRPRTAAGIRATRDGHNSRARRA